MFFVVTMKLYTPCSPDLVSVVMLTDVLGGPEDHGLYDHLQLVEGEALQRGQAPPQRHLEVLLPKLFELILGKMFHFMQFIDTGFLRPLLLR